MGCAGLEPDMNLNLNPIAIGLNLNPIAIGFNLILKLYPEHITHLTN